MDTLTFKNNLHKFKLFQWRNGDFLFNERHAAEPLNCISFSAQIIKDDPNSLKKLLFLKNIELLNTTSARMFKRRIWTSYYCYFNSKKDLENIIEVLNVIHGKVTFYSGYYIEEHGYILHEKRINKKDFFNLVFPEIK